VKCLNLNLIIHQKLLEKLGVAKKKKGDDNVYCTEADMGGK
jgi:hypothetical protein